MKALGLHQPFAHLIRVGTKTIETRFWSTSYRGPLLICSTKGRWPGDVSSYPASVLDDVGTMQCVVDLVDCRPGTDDDEEAACCPLWAHDKHGNWVQKFAMVLANVRPVTKREVKCGRRWFNVDDALIEVEK